MDSSDDGDFYEATNVMMIALLSEAKRTASIAVPDPEMTELNLYLTITAGDGKSRVEISKLTLQQWAEAGISADIDTFG